MKTSASNRRIRVLLTALKNGTLIPRPEFQRRLVWTNKHKLEFIKTVLMHYPFPEIYIAAGTVDPDTGEGTEMLVDGQQRITTLYQYFTNSDDLSIGDLIPYSKLDQDEKMKFLEYEVVVRDLGKKSIEEIVEVFSRINSTKYSLNAMEIHNARYDGEFKKFAEDLSQHSFFEQNRIFTANDIRRMGDMSFCLSLVITVMSTYFNRENELDSYLSRYNDNFEEAGRLSREFDKTFNFINECGFEYNSRVWKKADIFTLIIEIHRLLIKESNDIDAKAVGRALTHFYSEVDRSRSSQDKFDDDIVLYSKLTLQATNDRSVRIKRGEIIRDIILKSSSTQSLDL